MSLPPYVYGPENWPNGWQPPFTSEPPISAKPEPEVTTSFATSGYSYVPRKIKSLITFDHTTSFFAELTDGTFWVVRLFGRDYEWTELVPPGTPATISVNKGTLPLEKF